MFLQPTTPSGEYKKETRYKPFVNKNNWKNDDTASGEPKAETTKVINYLLFKIKAKI